MQDPEFERKVQQKMEELSFSPSESVWAGVEMRLKKEKERKTPLFWIFLMLGIVLAGSVYLFYPKPPAKTNHPAVSGITRPQGSEEVAKDGHLPSGITGGNDKSTSNSHAYPKDQSGTTLQNVTAINLPNSKSTPVNFESRNSASSGKGMDREKDLLTGKDNRKIRQGNNPGAQEIDSDPQSGKSKKAIPFIASADQANGDGNQHAAGSQDKTQPSPAIPSDPASGDSSKRVHAGKDSTRAVSSASSHQSSKQHKNSWHWGLSASGGVSTVYQDLFARSVASPVAYYSLAPTAPAPVLIYSPSAVRPGFSFSAGAFLEKAVTRNKRLSVTIGLNYRYFSSNIQTGSHSNNTIIVSPTSTTMAYMNGYYQNGSSENYTNQYHFLEMPAGVEYQVLPSGKWSLWAEAGLSVSQLLGSNALHFDYGSGAYYKDNRLLNKTQMNGSIALMGGFYQHKTLVKFGPAVQYGFTNLVIASSGDKEHLFFAGLQVKIVPGKK